MNRWNWDEPWKDAREIELVKVIQALNALCFEHGIMRYKALYYPGADFKISFEGGSFALFKAGNSQDRARHLKLFPYIPYLSVGAPDVREIKTQILNLKMLCKLPDPERQEVALHDSKFRGLFAEKRVASILAELKIEGALLEWQMQDGPGVDFLIWSANQKEVKLQVKASNKLVSRHRKRYPSIPVVVVSWKSPPTKETTKSEILAILNSQI